MKLISGVAFVSAFTVAVLTAGAAAADCKSTCNDSYTNCQRTSTNQIQCLSGWRTCKLQCSGPAVAVKSPAVSAGAPKGGAVQKAAVKK